MRPGATSRIEIRGRQFAGGGVEDHHDVGAGVELLRDVRAQRAASSRRANCAIELP